MATPDLSGIYTVGNTVPFSEFVLVTLGSLSLLLPNASGMLLGWFYEVYAPLLKGGSRGTSPYPMTVTFYNWFDTS